MPRFGDNSARNASEDNVKRAYVGGAALAGAGAAGGGLAVRNAGRRRLTATEAPLAALRQGEVDQRNALRNMRGIQSRLSDARKVELVGNKDITRYRHAIQTLKDNQAHPNVKSPGVQGGVVTRQKEHTRYLAQFKGKVTRAQKPAKVAIRTKVVPIRNAGRQASAEATRLVGVGDAMARASRGFNAQAGRAKTMIRGGKIAIGVGAAVPLAALATRNRVGNDWKANPRPAKASTGSKLAGRNAPKADTAGLNARERAAAESGNWDAFASARKRRNGL